MTIAPQPPVSTQPLNLLSEQAQTLKEINSNLAEILQTQLALLAAFENTRQMIDETLGNEPAVAVTDIDIPIGRLIRFMIMWAIATFIITLALAIILGGFYWIMLMRAI
jgi:hypothetical protein